MTSLLIKLVISFILIASRENVVYSLSTEDLTSSSMASARNIAHILSSRITIHDLIINLEPNELSCVHDLDKRIF